MSNSLSISSTDYFVVSKSPVSDRSMWTKSNTEIWAAHGDKAGGDVRRKSEEEKDNIWTDSDHTTTCSVTVCQRLDVKVAEAEWFLQLQDRKRLCVNYLWDGDASVLQSVDLPEEHAQLNAIPLFYLLN